MEDKDINTEKKILDGNLKTAYDEKIRDNRNLTKQGIIPLIYDDVFKTMEARVPRLFIPVINEIFQENYAFQDEVEMLYNEQTSLFNTFRIKSRRSDSKFRMEGERYHIECESTAYGDISIRMFEYDWMEAVERIEKADNVYKVKLQKSAVVFLRSNGNTPDYYTYQIILPDGKEVSYDVAVMKNFNYDLEEIFEKKLFLLLPYYMLRYETDVKNTDSKQQEKLADTLECELHILYNKLSKSVRNNIIDDYEVKLLLEMIRVVIKHLFRNYKIIEERMAKFMGGQVLEFEWETEYRKKMKEAEEIGWKQGIEQGIEQGIKQGKIKGAIEIYRETGVDDDTIREIIMRKYDLTEDVANEHLSA